MNFLQLKKMHVFKITYYLLFLVVSLFSPILAKFEDFTLYGNVRSIGLDKKYENAEDLLGFQDTLAFPGDTAYKKTIEITEKNRPHTFCALGKIDKKQNHTIRILSLNVHNFHRICSLPKNMTRRKNPIFAVNLVKHFEPDIVMFQEIVPYAKTEDAARKHQESGLINVDFSLLDNWMNEIGLGENVKSNDHEKSDQQNIKDFFMGKGIYTRQGTILEATSKSLVGARGFIRIIFKYPGSEEKILLYTVQLSFGTKNIERTTKEIQNLVAFIEMDKKNNSTENVIIMGDFNNNPFDSGSKGKIFNDLRKDFVLLNDNDVTAFNQNPKSGETIDLVWVSKKFKEHFYILNRHSGTDAYKVVVKSDVSDHWPIYIDLRIKSDVGARPVPLGGTEQSVTVKSKLEEKQSPTINKPLQSMQDPLAQEIADLKQSMVMVNSKISKILERLEHAKLSLA